MKKRLIAILIVLTMAVCVFPVCASADNNSVTENKPVIENGNYVIPINGARYEVPVGTVLARGSSGESVRIAQMKLNELDVGLHAGCNAGTADGDFGKKTEDAVWAFQSWFCDHVSIWNADKIGIDGIIGKETWAVFTKIELL